MSIIFGAGGVAREVAWLINEAALLEREHAPTAFVTVDGPWQGNEFIDGIPIIAESDFFSRPQQEPITAFIAIGLPSAKARAVAKAAENLNCRFPILMHPQCSMDRRPGKVTMGEGVIVYATASLTTEVTLAKFVHVNPGVTVGHQSHIGAFTTLCPGCSVSGNVVIGSGCFIGAGSVIKEGVVIADNCMIGAGAVVINTINESGTWVGVPARKR